MSRRHHAFWPRHLSHHLGAPETNLFFNVEVSAARYPHKPFLIYFNTAVTFLEFKRDAERLAGYLEQKCGVRKGDRVMLCMQNSPQFALAFYAILRANAVVVPKAEARGKVSGQEIIEWAPHNMAAYKYPRIVEFDESLQKNATGKVNWRALQEREQARG